MIIILISMRVVNEKETGREEASFHRKAHLWLFLASVSSKKRSMANKAEPPETFRRLCLARVLDRGKRESGDGVAGPSRSGTKAAWVKAKEGHASLTPFT
jgi:hypothetical protein